ncbi:hypothetical protein [Microbacterium rhizophilus]|uniref:hypothetical protein n=1 Tax=Microbacterium rhizophilus TaxID=3138934 RepID=UPI0031E7FC22
MRLRKCQIRCLRPPTPARSEGNSFFTRMNCGRANSLSRLSADAARADAAECVSGSCTAPAAQCVGCSLVAPGLELLMALWSGLLLAGAGGFLIHALRARDSGAVAFDVEYLVDRATRDVGIDVLDWLFVERIRLGADPILMKSLLVAEALQRPRWLRRIERLSVRLGVARTSGVMQMPAVHPLSDRESVTNAVDRYAGKWCLTLQGASPYRMWDVDSALTWAVAASHNGERKFADSVFEIARWLVRTRGAAHAIEDGSVGLILELRRYADRFALRGATSSRHLLVVQSAGDGLPELLAKLEPPKSSQAWWAWECEIAQRDGKVRVLDLENKSGSLVLLSGTGILGARQDVLGEPEETPPELVRRGWFAAVAESCLELLRRVRDKIRSLAGMR